MRMKSFRPNDRLGRNAVSAAVTKAVVASSVELSPAVAVVPSANRLMRDWPEALSAPVQRQRWQQNDGSLLIAVAILFRVLSLR
jgi:hypothetical protein